MENDNMKKCPYCAELIRTEAIKCRYCGSDLTKKGINLDFLKAPGYWHRVNEGKKIAGVCTGISRQLDSPILIMPLRLFFIITTLFWGFGLILYAIMWLLMPPPTDKTVGKTTSGMSQHDVRTEETVGDIKKEETVSDTDTEGSGPETETKETEVDIITIEESETDEGSIEDKSQSEKDSEQFDGLPDINENQEKSGKEMSSERRKMTPLFGIGMLALGVFIALRMYMGVLESFVGIAIPPTLVIFGVVAVASIMTGAVIKLSAEKRVKIAG